MRSATDSPSRKLGGAPPSLPPAAVRSRGLRCSALHLASFAVWLCCAAPSQAVARPAVKNKPQVEQPAAPQPPPKPVEAANLPSLLKAFAGSPGVYAQFTEKKFMALLAAPLESAGTLYFTPPGLLARHTAQPEASVLLIEPQKVRMFDGKHWESIELESKPVVRLFVESFVRILQGDEAALRRLYGIDFKTEAAVPSRWTLILKPKIAPMDKLIDRLELHGDKLVMDRMRIVEVGGDETVTSFSHVDTGRRYSEAEKGKFFFQGR